MKHPTVVYQVLGERYGWTAVQVDEMDDAALDWLLSGLIDQTDRR